MTMTPERLAEIKARCERASAGSWEIYSEPDVGLPPSLFRWWREAGNPVPYREPIEPMSRMDMIFIAHARQDIPDLLARVEELTKALRQLTFAARTSGGVAGRDDGLCAACDEAEAALNGGSHG